MLVFYAWRSRSKDDEDLNDSEENFTDDEHHELQKLSRTVNADGEEEVRGIPVSLVPLIFMALSFVLVVFVIILYVLRFVSWCGTH